MPVTTTSAALHIAPSKFLTLVITTLLAHSKRKARRIKGSRSQQDENPQDDLFFDEAFNIVKAFIDLGTKNTIESLQAFTNTHVPAPYWALVCPVVIPLSTCNSAADALIEWFGPEELKEVVGGERWWQVRGLNGIDAEWVAGKRDVNSALAEEKRPGTNQTNIACMEHLENVMLYVHGGGYSWGSINTHRHQVLHHAEKFKGRAFLVNYRKAPQYPWPCPLQDVIAAYLYLIRPPPDSPHNAISHSKIVFAGDSAGGGICLTVLTILRDLGLPMPAGAVLISPWVDLTHSFPSVMDNCETDIIPKYGFLAKPSTSWPLPTQPQNGGRILTRTSNTPPMATLRSSVGMENHQLQEVPEPGKSIESREAVSVFPYPGFDIGSGSSVINNTGRDEVSDRMHIPKEKTYNNAQTIDCRQPTPTTVLMENPDVQPLELRSQIQMYATMEQLTHPLVSPVLQGSLGNLPPLYIIAGEREVLRDEIIYIAHKAAYPSDHHPREDLLSYRRQKENAEKFTKSTNVRLQVFDGMCHVLTVFMFTKSAKFAYQSIGEFISHVTTHDGEHVLRKPFPELPQPPKTNSAAVDPQSKHTSGHSGKENSTTPMIRERVDLHGAVRPMEPPEELPALRLEVSEIGLIKEAPALRWAEGQNKWDKRYFKKSQRVLKQKAQNQDKAARMIRNALEQGFVHISHDDSVKFPHASPPQVRKHLRKRTSLGTIQPDRRWGPLDLENECPPASAIAARRDTPEALALLKKHIYFTAPATHLTIPKLKAGSAMRAALDPNDDPNEPPPQSASEMQVKPSLLPVHGLRMWDNILRYLGTKTSANAAKVANATAKKVGLT